MNQRKVFSQIVFKKMKEDENIHVVTGDLGYGMWDRIRDEFPERFHNVGAAEQFMLDFAVGLSLSGKKPIVYSITPFLLYRGFETLRTYIDHEKIPVTLVGSGRGNDYLHDGFSHDASDDSKILSTLSNFIQFYPIDMHDLYSSSNFIGVDRPVYINLKR